MDVRILNGTARLGSSGAERTTGALPPPPNGTETRRESQLNPNRVPIEWRRRTQLSTDGSNLRGWRCDPNRWMAREKTREMDLD